LSYWGAAMLRHLDRRYRFPFMSGAAANSKHFSRSSRAFAHYIPNQPRRDLSPSDPSPHRSLRNRRLACA